MIRNLTTHEGIRQKSSMLQPTKISCRSCCISQPSSACAAYQSSEEYGGMDLDFNTGLLFGEAISTGFSFATTIGAHTSIGSLPIVYYGTEDQKAKYLPKIATLSTKPAMRLPSRALDPMPISVKPKQFRQRMELITF